ncbi:MAG TPA: PKD domain-containing protein [Methanospirillum sp.]|uniref:TolB family protein n=1 Tax=Methanospirillum sp. TaxID=45200 RepID=UPI002C884600|nr:PKD domain-containing protein [Methanospirillum sp.]HWQ63398.1 PKD domain-containing protein [Methanospirillum sp.]
MKVLTGFIALFALLLLCGPVLAAEFEPVATFSIQEAATQVPGAEEQMTFDSIYDWEPRLDERYLTWVSYSAGQGKVWYYDTKDGKRETVSNVACDQNDPDISDGKIVWDDTRSGNSDIYSYDISSGKEEVVYSSTSNKFRPAISNGLVAFEDYNGHDNRDIGFIKAGSTGKPVYIDQNQMDKANPDVDGDWIVYQQLDDGKEDWNIYAYNVKTEQLVQVTRDPATQQKPRISGDLVVWEDNRSGKWDIFMYNLKKDLTTAITYDDVDDHDPSVSGSNVVWSRVEQNGVSHIYMVNLQIPATYVVSPGPGNQIKPDIYVDKVAWQDDRLGNWDIFLYTLKPNTPFRAYEFYGPVTVNYLPAPVGTEIQAKVNGKTKGTITVSKEGYYGGQDSYSGKLSVNIEQADIGKVITFWADGVQGTPTIPISGGGTTQELSLNFASAKPQADLCFYGSVFVDGQAAEKGTTITARIDDVIRGEITTTQYGMYGGPGDQEPALKIPITENDLGKHVTFWQGDYKSAETFQITSGGRFKQDLSFTKANPLSPYEFYGYIQFDGKSAPAGTPLEARIDSVPVTTYVTRYSGSYGGPGETPEDARLIVPIKEADVGKTISFWTGTQRAPETQVIARSGERIVRKDLDFSSAPSGIIADFSANPTSGATPLTVKFTDLSAGNPTMWVWDFGDGPIPMDANDSNISCASGNCNSIANPTHTYRAPGTYTVTLTASNRQSSDTKVKTGYITVGSTPSFKADFTAAPTSGPAPLTVQFTDLTTGNPTMWNWDFGDGPIPMSATDANVSCASGNCNSIANPKHTYSHDGVYTVTLRASNQYGNSDTQVKQAYITVSNTPVPGFKADFTAAPTSGAAPLTVQFTDRTTGNPTMWNWDFGDGPIPMGANDSNVSCASGNCNSIANPKHTYSHDGVYTVTLRASNQYGNSDTQVKQAYITVSSIPGPVFNADFTAAPTSGPAPLTVQFTDKSFGSPTMWVWNFGDGPIPMDASGANVSCASGNCNSIANPRHTYTKNGAYTVTLTASNAQNSDTETKVNYINVQNIPTSDSIPISAGWNFISVPKKLVAGKDTAAIFGYIEVDGHSIFQYDSVRGQWLTLNQSNQIKPLEAVWLYSKKADSVPLSFDSDPLQIPQTRELKRGWNAVGFTGFEPLEAKFTLLSVQDKWVNCLGFDRVLQKYNEMIIKGRNDDTKLNPYNGYWLFMSEDGVLAAISA